MCAMTLTVRSGSACVHQLEGVDPRSEHFDAMRDGLFWSSALRTAELAGNLGTR